MVSLQQSKPLAPAIRVGRALAPLMLGVILLFLLRILFDRPIDVL